MFYILIFTVLTTFVLLLGLVSMAMGEKFGKKYGTKLMMLRVSFQAVAIIFLAIAYLASTN